MIPLTPEQREAVKHDGNLLLTANSQLDTPLAWAALITLSLLGILLFLAVAIAEKLLMPWNSSAVH